MGPSRLSIYLNDHLAGATAGVALARRTAGSNAGTDLGDVLTRLADELEQDRAALREVMGRLGVRPDPVKTAAAVVGERFGRFKLNGSLRGYSPLSRLVELEGLALIAASRLACWRTLRELAETDSRLDAAQLDAAASSAERQRAELEGLRGPIAADALG